MLSQNRSSLHEFNSTIQPNYLNIIRSAISCVFLSWLVRSTIVLAESGQNFTERLILAMVCHFYPGLDWSRLGLQGTLVPTTKGKGYKFDQRN